MYTSSRLTARDKSMLTMFGCWFWVRYLSCGSNRRCFGVECLLVGVPSNSVVRRVTSGKSLKVDDGGSSLVKNDILFINFLGEMHHLGQGCNQV